MTAIITSLLMLVGLETVCAENITTLKGEKLVGVTISRVEPDGIVVLKSDGIVKLPFTDLSPELQAKYGYNPQKAAEFAQAIKAAQAERQAEAAKRKAAANAALSTNQQQDPEQPQVPTMLPRGKPDIPSIEVRTDSQGTSTVHGNDDRGWQQKQDVHTLGIRVDLRSFSQPRIPYDVQCFVIARADADGSDYIYDVQRKASSAQFDTVMFEAPRLTGSGERWIFVPITGFTTSGEPVSGSAFSSQRLQGSKFYGWLVRVISGGVVVRIESNQPTLKFAAERAPTAFDAAIARVKQ